MKTNVGINGTALAIFGLIACAQQGTPVPKKKISSQPPVPVEIRASVDRAVATTGDLIHYTITLEHNKDVTVALPDIASGIAGFRIVNLSNEPEAEIAAKKGRMQQSRTYELRADLVGSYILPAVTVHYGENNDSVTTSEIFVEVASVLPTDAVATDIRDIKPLQPMPGRPIWVYWVLLGVATLLLLLVVTWQIRRRRRGKSSIPHAPAHEIAFSALRDLKNTDFNDPKAVRRYYFMISTVLRTYVEDRFELNATDLTTTEILASIPSEVGPDESVLLKSFLIATDQVKFAAWNPADSDIESTYECALKFVELTQPQTDAKEAA